MPVVPEPTPVVALRTAEAATRRQRRVGPTTFPDPQSEWPHRGAYDVAIEEWRELARMAESPNEPHSQPELWEWVPPSKNARACGNGFAIYYSKIERRVCPALFKCTSCIDHQPCMETKAAGAHQLLIAAAERHSNLWYTEVSYDRKTIRRISKRLSRLSRAEVNGYFWIRRWDDVLCIFSNVDLAAPRNCQRQVSGSSPSTRGLCPRFAPLRCRGYRRCSPRRSGSASTA